jgi:hypothetical protein
VERRYSDFENWLREGIGGEREWWAVEIAHRKSNLVFLVGYVLPHDRIELFEFHLFRLGLGVLGRRVEVTRTCGRN